MFINLLPSFCIKAAHCSCAGPLTSATLDRGESRVRVQGSRNLATALKGGSLKIIHLTDLHLAAIGRGLHGRDQYKRLQFAIADINARHSDAAFVLITGDLAYDGELAAYEVLLQGLNQLSIPFHLVLGNHDNRALFRKVFPSVPVDGNGFVQKVIDSPAGRFVFLDTNQPGIPIDWLCVQRLQWADKALTESAGCPVYLALNNPPQSRGLRCMDVISGSQQKALRNIIARHGNVRHLFLGHVGQPAKSCWNGIPCSTHRGLNHQAARDFSGVNGRPETHMPPSYAVVEIASDATTAHVHKLGGMRL